MLTLLLSLMLLASTECYIQAEAMAPNAPPCGLPHTREELLLDAGCAVVFHDGTNITLVRGWTFDSTVSRDPRKAIVGFGYYTHPDAGTCLCPLWERWPEYVIWEKGNPCTRNIS